MPSRRLGISIILSATQSSFAPYHWSTDVSPQIDVSQGYEAYVQERRAAGSEQIKKIYNLMRRIEREVGPLSFVASSMDPRSLATVLAWKSEQYLKSGNNDLFAPGWVREAVSRIFRSNVEGFAGMLSLLYAGDRMVAGHIGMRSHRVWHYWFPAYDPASAKYSPGLMLLLKMAGHAPEIGVRILDLGKGVNSYKERLMNSSSLLASGRLEIPSWRSFYGVASRELRSRLQNSSLRTPARVALQCLRKWRHGGGPEAK